MAPRRVGAQNFALFSFLPDRAGGARLVDFKIFASSLLGYTGSISAPGEATLKEEAHALQSTTAGPHNATPADLMRAGSVCGLGSDLCRMHMISLAARFRTAACSGTLANGLAKIRVAREYDDASMYAHTPEWEERFLKTSMAFSTMEAYEYVRWIDRTDEIAGSARGRIQVKTVILLYRSPHGPPTFWDRSVDTMWRRSYR